MNSRNITPTLIRIFKKINYQLPLMTINFRIKEALFLLPFIFIGSFLAGQDCTNPEALCSGEGSPNYSYLDGAPSGVGTGFCFQDAPNAVFYSFETQDINQFPFIDYQDSTATIQFSVDSCLADTAIGIAVFEAIDICDASSYSIPVFCTTDTTGGGQIFLTALEPSTTYYIMLTGLNDGLGGPDSECSFNLDVSGPALEYDLGAEGYQSGRDPNSASSSVEIFEGETVVLTADGDFGDLEWSGPQLNQTMGDEVTAAPQGVDITVTYVVTAEIEGCTYTDEVTVFILPPIVASNTFTPNSDGFNDVWFIEGINDWPNAQIFVYSRWGNKVFQATNYENDWGGDDLPAATYYYVIELNPVDFDAEPITGSVTILR
jgi:gliding motility-associated-like protein